MRKTAATTHHSCKTTDDKFSAFVRKICLLLCDKEHEHRALTCAPPRHNCCVAQKLLLKHWCVLEGTALATTSLEKEIRGWQATRDPVFYALLTIGHERKQAFTDYSDLTPQNARFRRTTSFGLLRPTCNIRPWRTNIWFLLNDLHFYDYSKKSRELLAAGIINISLWSVLWRV